MALIVKIMSADPIADDDTRKGFKLITGVLSTEFGRSEDGSPVAYLWCGEPMPECFYPAGNTYVMNEAGRTIASFGCEPPPGSPVAPFTRA